MITNSTVWRVMSRSVSIEGIATLTIATSRIVMKNAVPTTARISQRRGFGSAAMSVKVPPSGLLGVAKRGLARVYSGPPKELSVRELPERAGEPHTLEDRLRLCGATRAPIGREAVAVPRVRELADLLDVDRRAGFV